MRRPKIPAPSTYGEISVPLARRALEKVRIDDAVVSNAVVIAYGVTAGGFRDVVAIDVVDTESKESWTTFLRALRKRGLSGTKLVISDAHEA